MNETQDAVKRPGAANALMFFGVIFVIGGTICFIDGTVESNLLQLSIAVPAIATGFMLTGFSAGLSLLTKIANYLARLVSKDDPPKPDAMKDIVQEAAALRSPSPEPEVYKL